MLTALYYSNKDIRLVELAKPTIGPKEVLVKIEASGICGSDVMEWYRRDKVPLVLGHEIAGTLVEVGRLVKGFKKGDRVVATHHVPCGKCRYCLSGHETVCDTLRKTNFDPGGFAEFVRLPEINVRLGTFRIPPSVSFEEATFVEPLGCVIRGQCLAGMSKGKTVLVVGSGLSGLLHIKLAKFLKAKTIVATDVDSFRLEAAKRFGAHQAVPSGTEIPKADLVILCSSHPSAMEQGLRSVERGGTVLIFTAATKDSHLPVATNEIFWRNEVTIKSSYAAGPADLKEALQLIAKKKIKVKDMITHEFALRDIQKGFDLVVRPQNSLKVLIKP